FYASSVGFFRYMRKYSLPLPTAVCGLPSALLNLLWLVHIRKPSLSFSLQWRSAPSTTICGLTRTKTWEL
uniref:Selenoprotein K n=1 Tax=Parascaris univalens TaxID=6257 RepID=A0A915AVE1_PARUN